MKRYDPCDRGSRGAGLVEAIDGEVVLYSDVAPLVEALRLIAQTAADGGDSSDYLLIEHIAIEALSTLDADGSKS